MIAVSRVVAGAKLTPGNGAGGWLQQGPPALTHREGKGREGKGSVCRSVCSVTSQPAQCRQCSVCWTGVAARESGPVPIKGCSLYLLCAVLCVCAVLQLCVLDAVRVRDEREREGERDCR